MSIEDKWEADSEYQHHLESKSNLSKAVDHALTDAMFDKLIDFIADHEMTDAEVEAEIRERGIDLGPSMERIKKALRDNPPNTKP